MEKTGNHNRQKIKNSERYNVLYKQYFKFVLCPKCNLLKSVRINFKDLENITDSRVKFILLDPVDNKNGVKKDK